MSKTLHYSNNTPVTIAQVGDTVKIYDQEAVIEQFDSWGIHLKEVIVVPDIRYTSNYISYSELPKLNNEETK